jgi:hypothetical protein
MIRVRSVVHSGELYLDTLQKPQGMSWLMCERNCSVGGLQICESQLLAAPCLSPTDIPNGTSQLPVDEFILNLIS